MSVKPVAFDNPDGTWEVFHDDAPAQLGGPHGGSVNPSALEPPLNLDGTPNRDFVIVPCPVAGCGSESLWPVGGGADAPMGQEMFVRLAILDGGVTVAAAIADIKARCEAMDGPERWQVDETKLLRELGG